MRDGGIAVVGDKDSILGFKAIGLDVFPVEGETQIRDTVHTLARTYSVIFITETAAAQIESLLKRYAARPYPVIVPIPSSEGATGFGMKNIRANIEKAIGADILFNNKEDK
ncbi:MAG: V-type ATP synthase subunit F [Clostridia bacterium]|nr:V-type ATP synthase subunit F [Clostridia bacterium]